MKKKYIDLKELKKIQIDILNFVSVFCENNDIKFWLDSGTLLGAVRHKGYIPWDDDIDIGMLRTDYDKFIKLFFDSSERYELCCYEKDSNWGFPFGKVLDTNTVLYEPNEEMGLKLSVYIDVFVYDNAPSDEIKLKKMYNKRNFFEKLHVAQTFPKSLDPQKKKFNFMRYPLYYFLKIFNRNYFVKKIIENSKKYKDVDCKYVGNFTSVSKIKCSKDIFESFVDLEFEGSKYKVPIGYDDWLKAFYGDYMKLPPKEKQISHHKFVAYYK